MSTTEEPKTEGKKAVNAPPTHLGWDSHNPVVSDLKVYRNYFRHLYIYF
jgi:hypothetical protein